MTDDNQIIARVKSGNIDAFSEIVERYQSPIFRYLYRLTGNYEAAQDLEQDTFIQAFQGLLKTEINVSFKAWLYKIATNNALKLHRRRVFWFISTKDIEKNAADCNESHAEQSGEQIYIREILNKIPHDQRICMVLHFIEGFKYKEIAESLGISEEAVRKRVNRGNQEFKKLYDSEEVR